MDDERLLDVDETGRGLRLDVWLARRLSDLSRARIQALIAQGRVLLDGSQPRPAVRLRAGQRVRVDLPAPAPARPEPEDIPLVILYEDSHLLVLDKPAGLVVHPGAGAQRGTLVNALLHHVHDLSGVGGELRPGIVHRLDRGTSGLLVVAKDDETHRSLSRQFARRTVEKVYEAIVLGVPRARQAVIDLPVGRDPHQRKRMSVRAPRGRPARSTYEVLEALDGAARLRVHIHTGRTHQIRVHLASIGHPVAGDATYGGRRAARSRRAASREALDRFGRPALHSSLLAFDHPASGARQRFESPLPEDMRALLDVLRSRD
jgi:23S rRNA pseudouridine1911/1915/1917 synthase